MSSDLLNIIATGTAVSLLILLKSHGDMLSSPAALSGLKRVKRLLLEIQA